MIQLLLVFLVFRGSTGLVCDLKEPLFNCSTDPPQTRFWLDATTYLTSTQVQMEFAYVAHNIVGNIGRSEFGPYQNEAYSAFGVGGDVVDTNMGDGDSTVACSDLNGLLSDYQIQGSGSYSLMQTVVSTGRFTDSQIFIFTASTDDNDIDNAAAYVNNSDRLFTMIGLPRASTRLEAHPNAWQVYRIPDMANPPAGVAYCIAKRTCLFVSSCDPAEYTTEYTTPYPVTTSMPTPSPQPSVAAGHGCSKCDYSKVWNDVVYVIDSSEATGATNLGEIWGLVQSVSPWFNVQRTTYSASNYSMRVGIVTYGSSASLVSPLGSINEDDIDNMDIPLRQGDSGTNLANALHIAANQLNSAAHRPNAKQVIVVLATTYKSGAYDTPDNAASSFTDAGGTIIVYEDVKDTSSHSATLQQIASPGYFISSLNSNLTTVLQAICDANCFCPANFQSYSSNLRQNPTGGCYRASTVPANYNVANHTCTRKFNNGFISSDTSVSHTYFLQDIFGVPTNFYIGLTMDSQTGNWYWADGTQLGSYQPWLNGVPTSSASGSCAYVAQGTQQWVQTDCRNGYLYTCESNPCDSTHYCPLSQD